jgi:hypothetical protein
MTKDTSPLPNWPFYAAVLILSALYYGLYFNSGFSAADDGNYAQIAYELYLGRAPEELSINYGILWFKIGEVLFQTFGVNYVLVKGLFFTVIAITNILIFYTILMATGSRSVAIAMTVIPVLVPAFPATAFYGLCILMNAAAQMRLASTIQNCTWRNAAIAGATLSVSFQIRPDFGYIFAVSLIALLTLAAFQGGGTKRAWRLFGAAGVAFLAAQAPLLLSATLGGYVDLVLQQYLSYPVTMIDYAVSGLQNLFGSNTTQPDSPGSTSLQRPGLLPLFSDNVDASRLAALIYAPIVAVSSFLVISAFSVKPLWKSGKSDTIAKTLVSFFAATAALPHYFFYRPDLSHIANFMPGYTVLAAVMIAWLIRTYYSEKSTWLRLGSATALLALALHMSIYLTAGLNTPGTGSIAGARDRTETFQANNGVDVQVSPAEKSQFEFIRDIIAGNSEPGDRIVCVPYCPGFAFMADRQMLFGNFYVDNSTPLLIPDWIPNAISLTTTSRPPIIIVMDWAINGTEASQFSNWASEYVSKVEKLSRDKVVRPGLTVYLL